MLVTLDDIRAAAAGLASTVLPTPLLPAGWSDRPLWLKPESLQPTGSFKVRGAGHAVAQLDAARLLRGVVTHSSGNHGQAVAYAARAAGAPATVVMPERATVAKVEAVRRLGADVVLVDAAERLSTAERLVAERGATLIPPYDHAAVIAGQGTVGLEIAEDLPDVQTVLVPVGGGGLVSGIAAAVKALCPRASVVGCEPALAGDLAEGFHLGRPVSWPVEQTARTMADGLRVGGVGELNWRHIERFVDDVVTVSEDAIAQAMRQLAFRSRLVAEPSGAVPVAALLEHGDALPAGTTVAVVSGGNVDPAMYAAVLAEF